MTFMRAILRFCLLLSLVLMLAVPAHAGPGVNLRWSSCFGDGGAQNRNFACDTNTGSINVLVCSFVPGQDVLQASGHEIVIHLATAGAVVPAWWQFKNVGTCRQGALGLNTVLDVNAASCVDWAQNGPATGGIGAYDIGGIFGFGANTATIKIATAVPAAALSDLFAGQEYFTCNVTITNAKTVGTGACTGCTVPVCLVFNSSKITTQVAANDRVLSGPTDGTDSNFCTWQGGAGMVTVLGAGCPAATPTRRAGWGAVKALYR